MFKLIKKIAIGSTLLIGTLSLKAQAATFIIEADDFAAGSVMCETGLEAGCHGTQLSYNISDFKIYARNLLGNNVFGSQSFSDFDIIDFERLRADFSHSNVYEVSLTARNDSGLAGDVDNAILQAYDADDNLLDSYITANLAGGSSEIMTVTSNTSIAYILAASATLPFIELDTLVFKANAPGTLSLLFCGLLVMGYRAYRKS